MQCGSGGEQNMFHDALPSFPAGPERDNPGK